MKYYLVVTIPITVRVAPKPIDDFEGLVEANVILLDYDYSYMSKALKASLVPARRAFAENVMFPEYKSHWTFTEEVAVMVANSNDKVAYASVGIRMDLENLIRRKYLDENGITKMHIMKECFYPINIAMAVPKKSPYLEVINYRIQALFTSGIIFKWFADSKDDIVSMTRCDGSSLMKFFYRGK